MHITALAPVPFSAPSAAGLAPDTATAFQVMIDSLGPPSQSQGATLPPDAAPPTDRGEEGADTQVWERAALPQAIEADDAMAGLTVVDIPQGVATSERTSPALAPYPGPEKSGPESEQPPLIPVINRYADPAPLAVPNAAPAPQKGPANHWQPIAAAKAEGVPRPASPVGPSRDVPNRPVVLPEGAAVLGPVADQPPPHPDADNPIAQRTDPQPDNPPFARLLAKTEAIMPDILPHQALSRPSNPVPGVALGVDPRPAGQDATRVLAMASYGTTVPLSPTDPKPDLGARPEPQAIVGGEAKSVPVLGTPSARTPATPNPPLGDGHGPAQAVDPAPVAAKTAPVQGNAAPAAPQPFSHPAPPTLWNAPPHPISRSDVATGEVMTNLLAPGPVTAGPVTATTSPVQTPPTPTAQLSHAVQASIQTGAEGPTTITLRPEELGAVRFEIAQSGDKLHVTLFVERADALELMRRHGEQLLNDLRQSGFSQASLTFGDWSQKGAQDDSKPKGEEGSGMAADPVAAIFVAPRPATSGRLDLRL